MLLERDVSLQTLAGITALFMAGMLHQNYKPFLSQNLNNCESLSLIASVLTLLSGQVFYTASSTGVSSNVLDFLGVLVMVMLTVNVLLVMYVIYHDWSPHDDANDEFESVRARSNSSYRKPAEFDTVRAAAITVPMYGDTTTVAATLDDDMCLQAHETNNTLVMSDE